MRKIKLLLTLLALLSGGVNAVKAYTVSDLTSDGWTEETSISDVGNKFFVFADANTDLFLGLKQSGVNTSSTTNNRALFYQTAVDPSVDLSKVFYLETDNTYYSIRNIDFDKYLLNVWYQKDNYYMTENITTMNGWTNLVLAYNNGSWTIKSNMHNMYLGSNATIANNVEVVEGKTLDNAGQYRIFSMSKSDFARLYLSHIGNAGTLNATMFIINNGFERNSKDGWTNNGGAVREGGYEIWHVNNAKVSQTLSLPNGKYQVSVQALHGEGDSANSLLFAKSGETEVTAQATEATNSSGGSAFANETGRISADANLGKISVDIVVNNGSLELGFKQTTGSQWDVFSNFTLTYTDPYLSVISKPLPANGALEADQWYVYDILNDGEYALSATEDIVYTQNDVLRSAITTTDAENKLSLTAGKLFIKSATAQTLTITPLTFSYIVAEPTITPTDGNYLTSISQVVFDFTGSSTDDPEASFAIVNGSAKASLKKAGAEIAVGTLSLDGYVLTADFGSVSLDIASDYTVELPADVVGYAGETLNTDVTATYHNGILAEGVYYFQIKNTDTYLSRGGDWGTQAIISNYGIHFEAALLPNGTYTLKCVDASLAAGSGKYLRFANGSARSNQDSYEWTIETADGGIYLKSDATHYLTTAVEATYGYTYLPQTETEGEAVIWVPISKVQYAANLVAAKNAESAAIATSAGISASSKAELEAVLSTNYIGIDKTSQILNASMDGSVDNWTNKKYGASNQKNITAGDVAEIWAGAGGAYQTIEGLEEGVYKVTVRATWRPGSAANGNAVGDEVDVNTWLYANSSQTQLMSWYAGGHTIDNRAGMKSSGDTYLNEVYVYVNEGEDLTIGIASPATMNDAAWLPFFGWTLTYYSDQVSDDDATTIIAQAETLLEAYMETAVNDDLSDALDVFKADKTITNFNALNAAITTATASKNAYVVANTYLTKVKDLLDNTNFYLPTAKAAVYDTPKAKYEAKTLTTDEINSTYTYQAFSYSPESDRYLKNTAANLLMPGWTINGDDATENGSGFYQNTWSTEDAGYTPPYFELWTGNTSLAATTVSGTIPGLIPNAKYVVSAWVRVQGNDKVAGSITMQVGSGTKTDVTTGDKIGTTNRYMKTFTASGAADAEGNLTLTFNVAADSKINWLSFKHVKVDILADDADYTALQKAIDEAKTHTLGFENGEYAPYNNVAAVTALAAANAINQEGDNLKVDVQTATEALEEASWTANVGEVNAIRWNKDEDYPANNAEVRVPTGGFKGSDGGSRIAHNPASNTGLTGLDQQMALMVIANTNATYGETDGYTLPLKANTVYKFSFKYAGWGENGTPTITILNANAETVKTQTLAQATGTGNNTATAWTPASVIFKTTAAGNYVVKFSTAGGRNAFGDLSLLKSAGTETVNVSNVGFATYVSDNDLDYSAVEGLKVYKATVSDNVITFTKVTTVPAGEGVLLQNEGEFTVPVANGLAPWAADENAFVRGTGAAVATQDGSFYNYILNEINGVVGFYQANNQTVAENRAYLQATTNAARIALNFFDEDGQTTSITEKATAIGEKAKDVYDLQGRKVNSSLNKGLYIVNGKKIVIK